MRLHSVHPGISPARVQQETGFEIVMPSSVKTTQPPLAEELRALLHPCRYGRPLVRQIRPQLSWSTCRPQSL